jgi:acyl-CoA synthetase (AMP-forming)/AMP-acid ligase II
MGYYRVGGVNLDEEGWLHTGDVAEFGRGGDLYIKGRLSEVIQTIAGSVFPAEVEQRAYECKAAEEAAAKGVERGGETVVAVFVVLKSGRTIQEVL